MLYDTTSKCLPMCIEFYYYFYYQLDNMIMFSDALPRIPLTTYIKQLIYLKQTTL